MVRLVTGGTGFIGKHLLRALARRDGETYVLVRPASRASLDAYIASLGAHSIRPLSGDITHSMLGLSAEDRERLKSVEIFHLAAVYDLEATAEADERANVEGTRNVVGLAQSLGARLHHMSSIAVAGGKWKGKFTEDMFSEGQKLDHPYYRTKYEAERLVRESGVRYRIYRPGLVIGSSESGEAARADGPYYAFKLIQRLRQALPSWVPLIGFEGGQLNIVPVDFVARAMDAIAHKPDLDGQTFHLTDPNAQSFGDVTNEFCRAAHAPQFTLRVDSRAAGMLPKETKDMLQHWRVAQTLKRRLLEGVRIPEAAMQYVLSRAKFTSDNAQATLAGTGVECPPLHTYAWKIWDYWERHLDPEALTERNLRVALEDRVVVVTGASSGIGRATASLVARHGARVVLVSRTKEKLDELKREIESEGGRASVHPTDLSDTDACERMIRDVLAEHGRVDILVNNAGRSIRRSIEASYDRFHDFQRTMQLNYFGAVKVLLAVLPEMRRRRRGDHEHPHAAGSHADDRSHGDLQELPDELARGGGRDGGVRHPDPVTRGVHPPGQDRGERQHDRTGPAAVRHDRRLPPVPGHRAQGWSARGAGDGRGDLSRGRDDGLSDARHPLLTGGDWGRRRDAMDREAEHRDPQNEDQEQKNHEQDEDSCQVEQPDDDPRVSHPQALLAAALDLAARHEAGDDRHDRD